MSKIHSLRLHQRLLRLELRDAKKRLMVPDNRWDYNCEYSRGLHLRLHLDLDQRFNFSVHVVACLF